MRSSVVCLAFAALLAACGEEDPDAFSDADIRAEWAFPDADASASIRGTVTLPGPMDGTHSISLGFKETGDGASAGAAELATLTLSGDQITYEVVGLDTGRQYKIDLGIDLDGDGNASGDGDLHGYFDGSTASPIQSPFDGRPVTTGEEPVTANFGIAVCVADGCLP